ncbi:MAG TPA: hypothetical protein VD788_17800 [Candidatus Polarisedimenticolaceae bacterium]|nr:hypothetical protein [Candidatus Polarisedimenticolaceae bacterium]
MQSLLSFKGCTLIDSSLIRSSGESQVSVGPRCRSIGSSSRRRSATAGPATSFSTAVGETVVVGTSRPMESHGALVVLLTALE